MSSALSITRSVGTPRAAFLDFPLGHTTGKPHRPALQRAILEQALAGFTEIREPGGVKWLPFRWSDDEGWKQHPLGRGGASGSAGDARAERSDLPQFQLEADRLAYERRQR